MTSTLSNHDAEGCAETVQHFPGNIAGSTNAPAGNEEDLFDSDESSDEVPGSLLRVVNAIDDEEDDDRDELLYCESNANHVSRRPQAHPHFRMNTGAQCDDEDDLEDLYDQSNPPPTAGRTKLRDDDSDLYEL